MVDIQLAIFAKNVAEDIILASSDANYIEPLVEYQVMEVNIEDLLLRNGQKQFIRVAVYRSYRPRIETCFNLT